MNDNCTLVDCFELFTQQEILNGDDRPVSKFTLELSIVLITSTSVV